MNQLRNQVLRHRRQNRVASADDSFEVFNKDTYQRVPSARQAALLADELAQRNPGKYFHVWADNQHVYEVIGDSMPSEQIMPEEFDVSVVCLCDHYGVNPEDFNIHENFPVEIYKGTYAWHVGGGGPAANLTDENWAPQSDQDAEALYQYCVVDRERQLHASRQAYFENDESVAAELTMWINNSEIPYKQLQAVEKNMTRKLAAGTYDREQAVKGFMYAVESGAKDYQREFGGKWFEMFPKDIRRMAAEALRDEFEAEVDINPQDYEQHVFKKHLPSWRERYPKEGSTMQRSAATFREPTEDAFSFELVSNTSRDLGYDVYGALDLGLMLLLDVGRQREVSDIRTMVQQMDPEYQYQNVDTNLFDRAADQLGRDEAAIAQFLVALLTDVNWHSLAKEVDEYFFGPYGERYSEIEELRRDIAPRTTTGHTANNQEKDIMTRKPSKNRRRRFASRVERAQRRDEDKRRQANHDDKIARLERRVASLDRLLAKAEQELKAEQRTAAAPREERPSHREERVAGIRERIATARRRQERAERARRRTRTRRRIAALQREADTARRVRPEDKRYVATYRKGGIDAGDPPYKIFDKDTGKTHVLVNDEK
jgi:hypothetical protein